MQDQLLRGGGRLKKWLAGATLDAAALREQLLKFGRPAVNRDAFALPQAGMGLSERRLCSFVGDGRIARLKSLRRRSLSDRDPNYEIGLNNRIRLQARQ